MRLPEQEEYVKAKLYEFNDLWDNPEYADVAELRQAGLRRRHRAEANHTLVEQKGT